mmetsp:Transcript_8065/g.9305  ORF Transcript_8065/g.9305 Transcript_8065/m.9305 type:complete len:712 (+) Transcript_8065:60-2195(+)
MMQRRRTDINANAYSGNATIRRQLNSKLANYRLNPYNNATKNMMKRRTKILFSFCFLFGCIIFYNFSLNKSTKNNNDSDFKIVVDNVPLDNSLSKNNYTMTANIMNDPEIGVQKENKKPERIKAKKAPQKVIDQKQDQDQSPSDNWHEMIQSIRDTFYHRYGGESEALSMLDRGVKTAAQKEVDKKRAVKHTAERMVRAALGMNKDSEFGDETRKFVISFGGYSVTVGRGNYYHQSYPFILQNIIQPFFEKFMNVKLIVRNSAIGGIPSFPYGWCLPNFLGDDSDVISWDYGMNEGNGAEAFEAYLRQGVSNLSKRPMMILLDNKRSRIDVLKAYHKSNILLDSIAVGRGEVVKKDLLAKPEEERPVGLQHWDEWGAPPGSPGQSNWHPKYMEHELIGWMLAMHFLDAIEVALGMLDTIKEKGNLADVGMMEEDHQRLVLLPEPVATLPTGPTDTSVTHVLFGTKMFENSSTSGDGAAEDESSLWHMDRISCRSNFLPNINGHMSEITVSGVAEEVGDDLMDKTDDHYNSGWVIDVGKVERDTKRKVAKVGKNGLGYIDMKLALYGIPESGTLKLSLPHEGPVHTHKHEHDSDMNAGHWFETLVLCEVNEKRGDNECKMDEDLKIVVGGIEVAKISKITSAANYLKKAICNNVEIPKEAKVKAILLEEEDTGLLAPTDDKVALEVEITVTGKHVTRDNGACSISHVVWQTH